MPPLQSRARASVPTLLSLSRLIHLIPRASQSSGWSAQTMAEAPIEPEDPPDSPIFWWKLGLSVCLVLAGGVFAGLTLALMGSDDLNLRVLSSSSANPKERSAANKVLRLLQRGRHWVLVVLLLGNVIVNESLPIFLDDVLGGGLYAVIVSTTMIVIFGEIIPQAVCVRYGLLIGGACAPLVWGLMLLFSPIAWPIAKLLDKVLGSEQENTYKKAELKSFLQFHREGEEPLRDDEIGILNGVLSLNEKHVDKIMTDIKDCLTLPSNKVLDHEAIDQILLSGFSRIPIHEAGQKDNFIGMLLVKKLITYNPDDEWPVSKFSLLPLPEAKPDINCFQALDYFQTGRAHLLLISNTPGQKGGALGIVSLEDLIEEIIGEEIVDETDRYEDNHSKKAAKRSGTAAVMRGIIERRKVINAFSRRPSQIGTASNTPPIKLDNPASNGNSGGGAEGILVQLDNGNLIAEPVGVTKEGEAVADMSRRLVVGALDGEEEETSSSAQSEGVGKVNGDGAGDGKGRGNANGNGGGETSVNTNSNTNIGTSTSQPSAETLHKSVRNEEPQVQRFTGFGFGGSTKSKSNSKRTMPFPSHETFERACKSLREKYAKTDRQGEAMHRDSMWTGWEWREHQYVPNQGYLVRRATRWITYDDEESFEPGRKGKSEGEGEGERPEEININDNENDDAQQEEMEEEEEDPASTAVLPRHRHRHRGDGKIDIETDASANAGAGGSGGIETRAAKAERVEVEYHIVYHREEGVAMFCFRAWDETGTPLPLPKLMEANLNLIHLPLSSASDSPTTHLEHPELDLDPSLPLIVSVKHPTTSEVMFAIHPTQLTKAVSVSEKLASESKSGSSPSARVPVYRRGAVLPTPTANGNARDREGEKGGSLAWLEVWLGLCKTIVDFSSSSS